MWVACCVGFFGFMRSGEFTTSPPQPLQLYYLESWLWAPTPTRRLGLFLHQAKNDPIRKGVSGRSGEERGVNALLRYMAIRPS